MHRKARRGNIGRMCGSIRSFEFLGTTGVAVRETLGRQAALA